MLLRWSRCRKYGPFLRLLHEITSVAEDGDIPSLDIIERQESSAVMEVSQVIHVEHEWAGLA